MKEYSNEAYYGIFSTLANRTRLAIIDALKDGPKNILEIAKMLDQDEKIISKNLTPLVNYGLLLAEGSGQKITYSLNKEIIGPLSNLLAFHVDKYCPGSKECIAPEKLREYMKVEAAKATYIEHE